MMDNRLQPGTDDPEMPVTQWESEPPVAGSATCSTSPELTLTNAGWVRRGKLWVSPYTGSIQSLPMAHCIEQMEACDRVGSNSEIRHGGSETHELKPQRNPPDVTEQPETPAASTPASGSVDGLTENTPCWCGEPNPHYEPMRGGCDGHGYQNCLCGGDFCVCHNHGEVECFGCPDCEGNDDDDYNDE